MLENRISAVDITALLLMIATGVIKGEFSGNKMFPIKLVLCERTTGKTNITHAKSAWMVI